MNYTHKSLSDITDVARVDAERRRERAPEGALSRPRALIRERERVPR